MTVLQAIVEKVEVVGVSGDSISKEGGGKGVGAQGLAKKAHTGGYFSSEGGGGGRGKAFNVGEGLAKAEGVVGERVGGISNGNARGGGHEFGFVAVEVYAQGSAFLFNEAKDGNDVSWVKAGRGVIEVRHGRAQGATSIVTGEVCEGTVGREFKELLSDFAKEDVEAEGGKDGAQGAALCKAFLLLE